MKNIELKAGSSFPDGEIEKHTIYIEEEGSYYLYVLEGSAALFDIKISVNNPEDDNISDKKYMESSYIEQLHCIEKTESTAIINWNNVKDAIGYEILINDKVYTSSSNTYTADGLSVNTNYVFRVRPIYDDSTGILSKSLLVRINEFNPQTQYSKTFLELCEGQEWFIDEIENLLLFYGKSINTINSKDDLSNIYALGLTNCNIDGKIPKAIGELSNIEYIYLAGNELNGTLPEELFLLKNLKILDLSENNLSGNIEEIPKLTELRILLLHHNNFSGKVPDRINCLSQMVNLDLSNNNFDTDVPDLSELNNIRFFAI